MKLCTVAESMYTVGFAANCSTPMNTLLPVLRAGTPTELRFSALREGQYAQLTWQTYIKIAARVSGKRLNGDFGIKDAFHFA